jgi:hypothetical protein
VYNATERRDVAHNECVRTETLKDEAIFANIGGAVDKNVHVSPFHCRQWKIATIQEFVERSRDPTAAIDVSNFAWFKGALRLLLFLSAEASQIRCALSSHRDFELICPA